MEDRYRITQSIDKSIGVVLINTFKEIEEKYLDYFSCTLGKDPSYDHKQEMNKSDEWLRNIENSSVVFVSIVAYGLEISEVNFIWVIRFPDNHEKYRLDLRVYGEEWREIMVVENWAPQAKILVNDKIGGFVSHCGWNLVMESMKYGVPIIAMPMHLAPPINARLLVELDGRLDRREIREVIRKVLMGKEGMEVQRKAKEMSQKMRCKGMKILMCWWRN
ncbi:hypothetical protein MKX03_002631 [Papaver bracteatum]|nr:hypothetical protein MKX03_002631 [Papaver bracteatum]